MQKMKEGGREKLTTMIINGTLCINCDHVNEEVPLMEKEEGGRAEEEEKSTQLKRKLNLEREKKKIIKKRNE